MKVWNLWEPQTHGTDKLIGRLFPHRLHQVLRRLETEQETRESLCVEVQGRIETSVEKAQSCLLLLSSLSSILSSFFYPFFPPEKKIFKPLREHMSLTHVNTHENQKKGTENKTPLLLRERQENIMSSNHQRTLTGEGAGS